MSKVKKVMSTYEREMKNAKFKKAFDQKYEEFLLSELTITMIKKNKKSAKKIVIKKT